MIEPTTGLPASSNSPERALDDRPRRARLRAGLAAFKRGWLAFAHGLAWINTRILLGAVYVLFFVPVGLVLALFRKDLLQRRIDRSAPSYWIERPPQDQTRPPADYERQY